MALAGVLQQLMMIWNASVTGPYSSVFKPNSRINNSYPSGRGYSDNISAKIFNYNPSGRGISDSPSGGITSIIPNTR